MPQNTYIHIKHTPVKLFACVSLAFRVFLILQTLWVTFPFHDFRLVFPIDGSKNVEQATLERPFVEGFIRRQGTRRFGKCDIGKTFALFGSRVQWRMNLGSDRWAKNSWWRNDKKRNQKNISTIGIPKDQHSRRSDVPKMLLHLVWNKGADSYLRRGEDYQLWFMKKVEQRTENQNNIFYYRFSLRINILVKSLMSLFMNFHRTFRTRTAQQQTTEAEKKKNTHLWYFAKWLEKCGKLFVRAGKR